MCYIRLSNYRLVTIWHFDGPLQPVFDTLFDSLRWPEWWPGVESVEECTRGNPDGTGSIRRYRWKSVLPYRLAFDAYAERVEAPFLLEGRVDGELRGTAKCFFTCRTGATCVRFEWNVRTGKAWMNLAALVAHRLFAYNHRVLMERGAHALAHRLGIALLAVEHGEFPERGPIDP